MRHLPSPARRPSRSRSLVRSTLLALAVLAGGTMPAAAAEPLEVPADLDLFVPAGFRYQDPNLYACTSAATMVMLNFVALSGVGGTGFRWTPTLSYVTRDRILAWSRTHDTLEGGKGSDPHGWRNALNYFGWGSGALYAGSRVYDDRSYPSYSAAIKAAIRALIATRKPVGLLAWAGRHAQILHGYEGLVGDPFAKDAQGRYTNRFSVTNLILSDPLKAQALVDARIGYTELRDTPNPKLRFVPYTETDSPYDDPYTAGFRRSRDEWYGRFVVIMPMR